MKGSRKDYNQHELPRNGEFGKCRFGWYGMTPNGFLANINSHDITEHANGLITVNPSIEVFQPATKDTPKIVHWHGFLKEGTWEECK